MAKDKEPSSDQNESLEKQENQVKPKLVLALNSGSSSLKFGLYRTDFSGMYLLLSGQADSIGAVDVGASTELGAECQHNFFAQDANSKSIISESITLPTQCEAIARVVALLSTLNFDRPDVIGHRIVHGGPLLRQHCKIDVTVLKKLAVASDFAPLHMPAALSIIAYAQAHFPYVLQVACFDTCFHAEMPDVSRILALPDEFVEEGIQRYGFHGLSCESIMRQLVVDDDTKIKVLSQRVPHRIIIAHLGNGVSITAVKEGKSIDTSMGLTPSGGVIMGTRCGDLDPGVLIYLVRVKKYDVERLDALVNHQSGMLGISGNTGDMRQLHSLVATDLDAHVAHKAELAIEMFCYAIRKQIGAMIAALNGVDLIVFTGGIGEHDPVVRQLICEGLSCFGIFLDEDKNQTKSNSANRIIHKAESACVVRVVTSQEDEEIARHSSILAN